MFKLRLSYLQLFNNKEFFTISNSKCGLSSSHLQWRHRCDWQIHKYRWYRIQSKNVEGSCHKKSFWSDIVPRLSSLLVSLKIRYRRSVYLSEFRPITLSPMAECNQIGVNIVKDVIGSIVSGWWLIHQRFVVFIIEIFIDQMLSIVSLRSLIATDTFPAERILFDE